MISYDTGNAVGILTRWTGSTLSRGWPDIVTIMIIGIIYKIFLNFWNGLEGFDQTCDPNGSPSCIPTEKSGSNSYGNGNWAFVVGWWHLGEVPMSVPLSLLLIFRTNISYARFFEGRGHVGNMVKTCRELSRGISTYVVGDDEKTKLKRANCARLLKAYTISVRLSCRKEEANKYTELNEFLNSKEYEKIKEIKKNFVLIILKWLGDAIADFDGQLLFPRAMDFMERDVGNLMSAWMGMQKLATTPFPFPWIQTLVSLMYLWMYTIPFPLVNEYGWIGPPVAGLLGIAIYGLWYIGCELEDPFGEEINDLDLEFFEAACNSSCKAMGLGMLSKELAEPPPPLASAAAEVQKLSRPAAVATPAGYAPVLSVATPAIVQSEAGIHQQLKSCVEFGDLHPSIQGTIRDHFQQFDQKGIGLIESNKQLTQLVTQLAFKLNLGAYISRLMDEIDKVNGMHLDWDINAFTRWFLSTVKPMIS